MASLTKKSLKEVEIEDLGGGLNEAGPPSKIPIRECITGENFRVSEDGKTKVKRPGLTKVDSIYDFGSKKVFGSYGLEETDEVKFAAFLEDSIRLKSAGEWSSIFSPTKTIDRPVCIAQDKALVFVAGYEKLITLKGEEAFYSGIEAPQTAPTAGTQAAGTDTKVTEYPASNQDKCGKLGSAAAQTLLAQSFRLEKDFELTKIKLKLKKIGSPTGNIWAEIHESKSGTSTTKNASATIVGQATDDLDVSTIRTSFVKVTDTSIAFVSATKKITDSNNRLAGFLTGDKIKVTGSEENDGVYTVATGGVAGEIVVSESLVDEDAGASITIETIYELTFSGTKPDLSKDKTYYLVVYRGYSISGGNYVEVGFDCSSPDYGDGRYWEIDGSLDWSNYEDSVDIVFELHGACKEELSLVSFGPKETGFFYRLRSENEDYLLAQSFKLSHNSELSKVVIPLKNIFAADGAKLWVEIHSSQAGTSATKGASTNIVGQPSDEITKGDLTLDFEWIEFVFSGTKPSLTGSTTYYLVLYCNYTPPDPDDHVVWTYHPEYEDGQQWEITDAMSWIGGSADQSFEIWGTDPTEKKAGEYAFENLDDIKNLRETSSQTLVAQGFKVVKDSDCSKVKLYLSKAGSPTGDIWAEIHKAQGGTSETKNLSDNIVGQGSDNVDVSTLSSFPTYGWVTFNFSGTKPSLKRDTIYYLVIYGDFTVSSSNYVKVGMDKIDPQYGLGKRWDINSSFEWAELGYIDLIFEVYLLTSDFSGDYSYVVTYFRGGNYPCESNPSPEAKVTINTGQIGKLTNIPVSSEPEVTHKKLHRTRAGDEVPCWFATIENSITEFDDSIPDSGLGDEVSYDNYPPPVGGTIEVWDDKLWVADIDDYPEGLFCSQQDYLEQFPSVANCFYPLREKEAGRVRKIKEFNGALYGLKDNSIWIFTKRGQGYSINRIIEGTGISAADSLAECTVKGVKSLVFLSNHYRIEIFDGFRMIIPELSHKVKKTLKSINKNYAYRSSGQVDLDSHEYKLTIPTGTSTVPNKIVAFNYLTGNLFVDTHHQNICSINSAKIDVGQRAFLFGTEEGELYKVDTGATTDDGNSILMNFRTGWIGSDKWLLLRRMFLDFVLPENKILIFKIYSNFREAADLSLNLSGSTPSGTDLDLRNIIHQRIDMAINGSFFSFEFINVEDVSQLEIIKFWLYLKTRPSKRTIKAS